MGNANKTKLRNALSFYTLPGILQTSEYFPTKFKIDDSLKVLYRNARSSFQEEEQSNIEMEQDFE